MKNNKFILKSNFPIILASKSEVRSYLIKKTGINVKQINSNCDEEKIKKKFKGKNFKLLSLMLAKEKAMLISEKFKNKYVIGADQICVINNVSLKKPKIKQKAMKQLEQLSGKTHKQICSVVLCYNKKIIWKYTDIADLKMKKLTKKLIKIYVDLDLPLNSCGSYKFESKGKYLFSSVKGNIDTILGMPILPLLKELHEKKIISYV